MRTFNEISQWAMTLANTFANVMDWIKKTEDKIPAGVKAQFKEKLPLIMGLSRKDEELFFHILYNSVDSWVREKIQALLDEMEDFQDNYFRYMIVSLFVSSPPGTTKMRKEVVRDSSGNPVLNKGGNVQFVEVEDVFKTENRAIKLLNVLAAEIHASGAKAVRNRLVADSILIGESITDRFLKNFGCVTRTWSAFKKSQSANFTDLNRQLDKAVLWSEDLRRRRGR